MFSHSFTCASLIGRTVRAETGLVPAKSACSVKSAEFATSGVTEAKSNARQSVDRQFTIGDGIHRTTSIDPIAHTTTQESVFVPLLYPDLRHTPENTRIFPPSLHRDPRPRPFVCFAPLTQLCPYLTFSLTTHQQSRNCNREVALRDNVSQCDEGRLLAFRAILRACSCIAKGGV